MIVMVYVIHSFDVIVHMHCINSNICFENLTSYISYYIHDQYQMILLYVIYVERSMKGKYVQIINVSQHHNYAKVLNPWILTTKLFWLINWSWLLIFLNKMLLSNVLYYQLTLLLPIRTATTLSHQYCSICRSKFYQKSCTIIPEATRLTLLIQHTIYLRPDMRCCKNHLNGDILRVSIWENWTFVLRRWQLIASD